MGWKRRFSPRHVQTAWSYEDEHVRILFRFDAIYNFTALRLFLANDFTHDVTLPRNITVQCSLHYPASTDQRPDSSVPLVALNPRADRSVSVSRWLVMSPAQTQWYTAPVKADEKNSGSISTGPESVSGSMLHSGTLGIGRFVDVRLYFDSAWIVLGEIAFENEKLDPNELQVKPTQSLFMPKNRASNGDGTVVNGKGPQNKTSGTGPVETSVTTDSTKTGSSFPIGQSTLTLGTICGILAALIGVSVIGLCFLWRQKRMRSRFEQHFHRGKRPMNGANHFDCLSEVQTPYMLPSNQNQQQQQQQHPNSTLANPLDGLVNPCDPGQTGVLYGAARTPLVLGTQNHTEFAHTLRGPFGQLIDPNYPTESTPHTPKLAGDLTGCPMRSDFDPARFGLGDQTIPASTVAPQSVQFIPFVSPQVTHIDFRPPLTNIGTLKPNGLSDDPFVVLPIHDSAIYTSLPGSDCDSQPYARIGNGDTEKRYSRSIDYQGKPFHLFVQSSKQSQLQQSTEGNGFQHLPQSVNSIPMFSTLLPPPPTLPLPMPPGPAFSSSPSQSSTSHSQTPDDLANSGTPLVSTDSMNGVGNGFGSTDVKDVSKARWIHIKHPTLGPNHGLPLSHQLKFARGTTGSAMVSQPQQQQQQQTSMQSHRYPIMDPTMHLRAIQEWMLKNEVSHISPEDGAGWKAQHHDTHPVPSLIYRAACAVVMTAVPIKCDEWSKFLFVCALRARE
ncbi:unnamed protein product [Echinostoma caproni]|uniref:F5/8 type C domain-containing protein n=1 Tax=Echinostoma caproni TaxID=27848 RepID=A0A183ASJ6_9TREM|nr:unnamed protein product [Echinostoma caproni]